MAAVADTTISSDALDAVATAVKKNNCVLFLGAGVHAPPPDDSAFSYPDSERPPIGSALSELLAAQCETHQNFPSKERGNLQRMSLFYEITKGRADLVDAVTAAVQTDKRPSPMLTALGEMGFPLIITTNYDRLLETALVRASKDPRVAVYTPELQPTEDFVNPTADSPVVFKIHGDIRERDTIVITDEDYIQFVLRMSNKDPYDPIPLTLKYFLRSATTLFVGYSLLDYNLRLLFKTLRWKMDNANVPLMYSVDFKPDPLIMDVWENQRRYVKFIAQDVWSFVPALYERVFAKELTPSPS